MSANEIFHHWPVFYPYWGKTKQKDDEVGDDYHLLIYHCLDVAACGHRMVKKNLFNAAEIFQRLNFSPEEGGDFFAWLLALHDIGKFSRGFQQLCSFAELESVSDNDESKFYSCRHDSLGYWLWNVHLRSDAKEKRWSPFADMLKNDDLYALDKLIQLTAGHHGKPPDNDNAIANGSKAFTKKDVQVVREWISALAPLFGLSCLPERFRDEVWLENIFTPASWPLAGLIVLADWIGSNQQWFPCQATPVPLEEYWRQALNQADKAVSELPEAATCAGFSGISHLFPFISKPTPLQQLAAELPLADSGPELFVLEDVTGAGKTEAALILTSRLLAAGKGKGVYVGLPTMATANAMFDRLQSSYRALFSADCTTSLMLAHSARQLYPQFREVLRVGSDQPVHNEYAAGENATKASCHRWFADSRKKALLAEVGVGTLDQALMAVLPFRHQSLRMLGLQNKVLLLDEVHAYDEYMLKLLERLLEYHASQGGSAIILSATLSQKQRKNLASAFVRKCHTSQPDTSQPDTSQPDTIPHYPLLTHYAAGRVAEYPLASRPEVCRTVAVGWLHQERECLQQICDAVRQGRCIAWIRNTVDDATGAFRMLEKELKKRVPHSQQCLFHSRFAFCDRLTIEKQVTDWCGKESAAAIRQGKVVIATQVIEQSLDLDFDMMITDLAPVDLLVQRAGRLQRHIRDSQGNRLPPSVIRDGRPAPVLQIFAPQWQQTPGKDWLQGVFAGTGKVYQDHGKLWLGQQLLRQLGAIRMPEDARTLVNTVYGEDVEPPKRLEESTDAKLGKDLCARACADQLLLDICRGYQHRAGNWSEEIEFSTRLSEPTVFLYLARQRDGGITPYADGDFGWEMSRLQVSVSRWNKYKDQIPHLMGDELDQLQTRHHLSVGEVIILPEPCSFYSSTEGLHFGKQN